MNILIVNDDGINSKGLAELSGKLSQIASVYICAPSCQRSAAGHGITIGKNIYVKEESVKGAVKAYSATGTPADCTKIGLDLYKKQGISIDMIFSGINHGANLGTDVLYSGTVSAAVEGRMKGYPSVAVSIDADEPCNFEYACALSCLIARKIYENKEETLLLNVNIPDLPPEDIKGLRCTNFGTRIYDEVYDYKGIEDGREVYVYVSDPIILEDETDDTDTGAVASGYAAVTPLDTDLTQKSAFDTVEMWCADMDNNLIY